MPDDIKQPGNIESIDLRPERPGAAPERPKVAENGPEQAQERPAQAEQPGTPGPREGLTGPERPSPVLPGGQPTPDMARQKRIEDILAKDLDALYLSMDEGQRRSFRAKGEETARTINALVATGKATAAKVLDLIKRWLMMIPGVNRFFLEQETKIKTDEILGLK